MVEVGLVDASQLEANSKPPALNVKLVKTLRRWVECLLSHPPI
jgi:hypothetical protein